MRRIIVSTMLLCCLPLHVRAAQIIAGTPEDSMFQRIVAETNAEAKLQALLEFEQTFPQSKVLPDIFLMIVDLYRQKSDRLKIIEYGEKVLKLDDRNVTAMMVLARNYAIDGKSLSRAVALAQQAVDQIGKMKAAAVPPQYTDAQWREYLQNTEAAARSILDYTTSIQGRKTPE
jgi:hypothetical protein